MWSRSVLLMGLSVALGACGGAGGQEKTPQPAPGSTPPAEDLAAPMQYGTYDNLWRIAEDWPGEWPSGFSIIADSVVVKGRNAMTPYEPLLYSCALPQGATYHVWNRDRIEADGLEFRTAFYRGAITANTAASVVDEFGETLTVSAGDVMRFEEYYSEGLFLLSFEGKAYTVYLEQIEAIADFEPRNDADLWVNVACGEGGDLDRAWLKYDEVIEQDGVGSPWLEYFGSAYDVIPGTGYPVTWKRFDFWSGEYPSGLAITADNVSVPAHQTLKPMLEGRERLSCPLAKNAVYSPWNNARPDVDYISFVYTTPIRITQDVTVTVPGPDVDEETGIAPAIDLDLKAGDTLLYQTYLGEGWFVAEYNGQTYEMEEMQISNAAEFGEGPDDEEWFRTTCSDGTGPVWINYAEAVRTDGAEAYNYTSYGDASDLTED